MCAALLTCTPPNFGGDPEPDPLVLSPISASIYVDTSITITISGGTPAYSVSVDQGGNLTKTSDTTWSFHATSAVLATITVTDKSVPEKLQTAEIDVNTAPAALTISPDTITLQVGETFQFSAVGGTPPYGFSKLSGVGTVDPDGLYHATAVGQASVEVTDSDGPPKDQADVNVVDAAAWNARENVDPGSTNRGNFASLALDSTGAPQIAHWQSTGNPKALRLARYIAGAWSYAQVASAADTAGIRSSLALDTSGYAHIAWRVDTDSSLRYREWNGSGWDVLNGSEVVVASNVGPHVSLALGSDGHPRIAYYDSNPGSLNLMYVKWTGAAWVTQTADDVLDVGQYASLALDPTSGDPCIAYYDASNGNLKYAYWTGFAWDNDNIIDSGDNVGQYTSLKIKPNGYLCVAYYDVTNGNLKYTENTGVGTAWALPTTVDDSADNVGQYASLALDPDDGHPHIAYYDATNGDLRYAARTGSFWFNATVDAGPASGLNDVGTYASLAIDDTTGPSRGLMRIAYYDKTALDLLYITEQ